MHVVVVAVIGCLRGLCRRGSGRGTSDKRQQDQKRGERAASVSKRHIDAIMTLDLADDEARALVPLLRRAIDCRPGAYRNSGQQTIPAAKIIANAQKNFFFIVGQFSKKGTARSRGGSTRPIPPSP